MDFDLDSLPELDTDGKPVGQEVDIDALPELDTGAEARHPEEELDALPDLDALPELDADGKPTKKEELGFWEREALNREARDGRKTGVGGAILDMVDVFGIGERNEQRKEYVETRLAMGEEDNPLQMVKLAQSLGIDQAKIDEIMARADSGQRSAAGFAINPDVEVMKQGFAELAKPLMAARIKTREAAQQRLANAEEQSTAGEVASGGLNMAKTVAAYSNPLTMGMATGGNIVGRIGRMGADAYTLDENGNPVKVAEGDRSELAAVKAIAGGVAEQQIWASPLAGNVLKGAGKAIAKIPGVKKLAAGAAKGTLEAVDALAAKLSESEGGRLLLKTGEVLGKVDEKLHFGSLPNMIAKSRLTEFCDEVVGLGVGEGEDPGFRERFGEWLGKVTSVENNVDMLIGMIGVHFAMAGASALKARGEIKKFRGGREEVIAEYIGKDTVKRLSNEDLDMMYRLVTSDGLTVERVGEFLDKIKADKDAAKERMEAGESLEDVVAAWREGRLDTKGLENAGKLLEGELGRRAELTPEMEEALDAKVAEYSEGQEPIARKIKEDILARLKDNRVFDKGNEGMLDEMVAMSARRFDPESRRMKAHDLRGGGTSVAEKIGGIEELGVTSWQEAEDAGLTEKDRYGRYGGGARQALNIAIHGTEALKTAVKNGEVSGDLAEELLTAARCELGARPPEERSALIDGILERAKGDEALARRMIDLLAEESSAIRPENLAERLDEARDTAKAESIRERNPGLSEEDARSTASEPVETADGKMTTLGEVAKGEEGLRGAEPANQDRAPQSALEGVENAERLKGTKLKAGENGIMGCAAFPEVRVEVSAEGITAEGLTAEMMAKPENAADAAALLAQMARIAQKNGIKVRFSDEAAHTTAKALMAEVREQGLAKAQAKLDTRAKLFDLLMKTTLGNGVTYDEKSFAEALGKTSNGAKFRDSHGNIYGFVDGEGVLHFNPAAINFNTPIHEYGHLALEAMKKLDNGLWKRGMELVRKSKYFEEIKKYSETEGHEYNYLKGSDEGICDEALAKLIGDRGERLVLDKGVGAELKAWLKAFWRKFKGTFGLADFTDEQMERMTVEEFVDAVNAELLRGSEFGVRRRPSGLSRREAAKLRERKKEEQHWRDMEEREAAEARERFEQSGMGVLDYIRSRAAEEGEPGFDLDWETMREIDHDVAMGRFAVGGIYTGSAADYANRSRQGGVDDGPSVKKIGTGEGSQVYGWGLYGSTVRGVAERYAKNGRGAGGKDWIKEGRNRDELSDVEKEAASYLKGIGSKKAAIERLKEDIEWFEKQGIKDEAEVLKPIVEELSAHGDEYREQHENVYEQTWFTNREPGDESHLLKWYEPVSEEQFAVIGKAGLDVEEKRRTVDGETIRRVQISKDGELLLQVKDKSEITGQDLYGLVAKALGTPQAASEFLARAGIDGVKYPVDSYGGKGVKDGDKAGWDYVSFRDDNIRVDHKWTDGVAKFAAGRPYQKSKQPEDGTFVRYTGKTPEATALTRRSVAAVRSSVASMGSLANAVPKVKGAIEGIDKALESIETGKPVKGFSKAVSPSNLITTLKVAGFKRTAEGAPSAYLMLEDRSIRISNHSGDAFRFKKDNNLSVKLVLGTTHKPFNKDAGKNVIEATYGGRYLKENPERFAGMLRDIAEFAATGEFHDTTGALDIKFSGSDDYVTKAINLLADDARARGDNNALQKLQQQMPSFKKFFAGSRVVDAKGEPLVVYRGSEYDPLAQEPGKGVIKPEAYFTADPEYAKRYTGNGGKVQAYYLNIRNPFDIRRPECLADLKKVYPDHEFQKGKSGALDWAEASTIDGEFLKENFGDKYDGIIYDEGGDPSESGVSYRGISYVPLDGGAQVKSATDNIGTFDPGNPDVRFMVGSGRGLDYGAIDLDVFVYDPGAKVKAMGEGETRPAGLAAAVEKREALRPWTKKQSPADLAKPIAFDAADMVMFWKAVSGAKVNPHVQKGERINGRRDAVGLNVGGDRIELVSRLFGVLDQGDIPKLHEECRADGFFRNEDPEWCAGRSKYAIEKERDRSQVEVDRRARELYERRVRSGEGGEHYSTQVLGHEIGHTLGMLPAGKNLGPVGNAARTLYDAMTGELKRQVGGTRKVGERAKTIKDEARRLIAWWHGQEEMPKYYEKDKEMFAEVFGIFLTQPESVQASAPTVYDACVKIIAGNERLAESYRRIAGLKWSGKSNDRVMAEVRKTWDREAQEQFRQLEKMSRESVSRKRDWFNYALNDRFGPMFAISQRGLKAERKALKEAVARGEMSETEAADRLKAKEDEINALKTSLYNWQRQSGGQTRLMVAGFDEVRSAAERDGVSWSDVRDYAHNMRVIELGGRATAHGIDPARAAAILDEMKGKLGAAGYAKVEKTWKAFRAVYEREVLEDANVKELFDEATNKMLFENKHYVTMKHRMGVEEAAEWKAKIEEYRKGNRDAWDPCIDIQSRLHKGLGGDSGEERGFVLYHLEGSFEATEDPIAATIRRAIEIKESAARNHLVKQASETLRALGAKGVYDTALEDGAKPHAVNQQVYGKLTYMDGGVRHEVIVPKVVFKSFKGDSPSFGVFGKAMRFIRNTMTLWNPMFINRAYLMDRSSLETNLKGMHRAPIDVLSEALCIRGVGVPLYMVNNYLTRFTPICNTWLGKLLWNENTANHYAYRAQKIARICYEGRFGERLEEARRLREIGENGRAQEIEENVAVAKEMLRKNIFQSAYQFDKLQAGFDETAIMQQFGYRIEGGANPATWRGRAWEKAKAAGRRWSRFEEEQEAVTKIIAYLYEMKKAERESGLRGAEAANHVDGDSVARTVIEQGGTPNLAARGVAATYLENATGFFWNVRKEGMLRTWRALKDHPTEWLTKNLVQTAIPAFLKGLMVTGGLEMLIRKLFDDDEEKIKRSWWAPAVIEHVQFTREAMKCVPGYYQRNYNVLPLAKFGDHVLSLRVKYSPEEFAIQNAIHTAMQKFGADPTDPDADWSTLAKGVYDEFLPNIFGSNYGLDWMGTIIGPLIGVNPYDSYRGRNIYDDATWKARWDAPGNMLQEMGKNFWNYSPFAPFVSTFKGQDRGPDDGDVPAWLDRALTWPVISRIPASMLTITSSDSYTKALGRVDEKRRAYARLVARDVLAECIKNGKLGGLAEGLKDVPQDLKAIAVRHVVNGWRQYHMDPKAKELKRMRAIKDPELKAKARKWIEDSMLDD